jgi:hypothetical protein
MKTISKNQRIVNVLQKAINEGFQFTENETLDEIRANAEIYLVDNTEGIEEECEVKSLGSHGQRIDWSDGKGYEYWRQGEIVDFKNHWFDSPETKVFHSDIIDSEANHVRLFYFVGETDYNKTEL